MDFDAPETHDRYRGDMTTATTPPPWTAALRIAIILAVTTTALVAAIATTGDADPTQTSTLVMRILSGLVISAIVAVAITLMVRWAERRPLSVIGVTTVAQDARAFLLGIAAWTVPAAATFGVLALLGSPLTISVPAPQFWLVLGLLVCAVLLTEAIPEELVFRGYISAVLAERLGPWWVIGVQTVLFVATATLLRGGTNALDLSLFTAMGLVLGYVRHVTGSVSTGIGIHLAFQSASQLILTHSVIEFAGPAHLAMIALGAVPFTVVAILIPTISARDSETARTDAANKIA